MSTGVGKPIEQKAKEIKCSEKGTLIISRRVFDIIAQMHIAALNKEWSGILWYKIVQGSINDPATLVCKCVDITPMNIGSGAYTEFDYNLDDEYVMAAMDKMVDDGTLIIGNGHSHNSMGCFFSGTDMDDLETNSKTNAGYLSLIYNYKHDISANWCAKIGIFGTEEVTGVITTRKNYSRRLNFNSWSESKTEGVDVSENTPVAQTINILQTIDLNIVRAEEDDWSDVDRAIELQSSTGYTANGVKSGGAAYHVGGNNSYNVHNNPHNVGVHHSNTPGVTRTDFTGSSATTKEIHKMKDRDLKGGLFKEENILEFIYDMIESVSKVRFTKDAKFMPNKYERNQAFKYLKVIDNEECEQLLQDFDIFKATVDAFVREKTNAEEVYPRLIPMDYNLFAKLILFTMLENDVAPSWNGYKMFKHGLQPYVEAYHAVSTEAISFLTRLHGTTIARFNKFVVPYVTGSETEANLNSSYPKEWD